MVRALAQNARGICWTPPDTTPVCNIWMFHKKINFICPGNKILDALSPPKQKSLHLPGIHYHQLRQQLQLPLIWLPNPPAATPDLPMDTTMTKACEACRTLGTLFPLFTHPAPPLHHWNQPGQMKIEMERGAEKERKEGKNSRKRRKKRPTRGRKKITPINTISFQALCIIPVSKQMPYPFLTLYHQPQWRENRWSKKKRI